MAMYAKRKVGARRPKAAAERIASAVLSRRQGAPNQRRHAAAVKSGNTPKGVR